VNATKLRQTQDLRSREHRHPGGSQQDAAGTLWVPRSNCVSPETAKSTQNLSAQNLRDAPLYNQTMGSEKCPVQEKTNPCWMNRWKRISVGYIPKFGAFFW